MPNWVQSKLTIIGKDADKIMKSLLVEDKENYCGYRFDFNKIKPMPKSLMIESSTITDKCVRYYLTKLSKLEYAETMNKLLQSNPNFARYKCEIIKTGLNEEKKTC